MDSHLLEEFDATVEAIKEYRARLAEEPVTKGQRGGARPSPYKGLLEGQQAHLVRLAKVLTARKLDVPVTDDALQELLD